MEKLYYYDKDTGTTKSIVVGEVEREFAYYGEKIDFSNKLDFEEVYTNFHTGKVCQGGALYNGLHFQFTTGGYCSVYDIPNAVKLNEFALDGIVVDDEESSPHCNAVCFSNTFYEESDEFPLLYLNAYNSKNLPRGTCYVHRINRDSQNNFSSTLIQTITIGFTGNADDGLWADVNDGRPYGNFVVDTDNGYLYAYTIRDAKKITRFFKFNLPDISQSAVTLGETDIIEYFDCDYFPVIQDNEYFQGKIYLCSGQWNVEPSIRVVDLIKKKQVTHIKLDSLGIHKEPESIVIYDDSIILTAIGKPLEPQSYRFYF